MARMQPERPAELDPIVPFPPMEAELVRELPAGDGWAYEPKWDGFRGVLENAGGELRLWSRNGRPLLRYFPELRPLGELLPPRSALDGEIVIARRRGDRLRRDADAAASRREPHPQARPAEIPAQFIAFDVLVWDGERRSGSEPLAERRAALERDAARHSRLSAVDRGSEPAARPGWTSSRRLGLDGVVAKRLDRAGRARVARGAVVKVKPERTADCVVVGLRWKSKPDRDRDPPARPLRRRRRARLRRLGGRRREPPRRDRRAGAAAARGGVRPALLGAEPLGRQRARGAAGASRARGRGAVRQGAGAPLPPRHEAAALPARQGSERVHVGGAAAAARAGAHASKGCSGEPPATG